MEAKSKHTPQGHLGETARGTQKTRARRQAQARPTQPTAASTARFRASEQKSTAHPRRTRALPAQANAPWGQFIRSGQRTHRRPEQAGLFGGRGHAEVLSLSSYKRPTFSHRLGRLCQCARSACGSLAQQCGRPPLAAARGLGAWLRPSTRPSSGPSAYQVGCSPRLAPFAALPRGPGPASHHAAFAAALHSVRPRRWLKVGKPRQPQGRSGGRAAEIFSAHQHHRFFFVSNNAGKFNSQVRGAAAHPPTCTTAACLPALPEV